MGVVGRFRKTSSVAEGLLGDNGVEGVVRGQSMSTAFKNSRVGL